MSYTDASNALKGLNDVLRYRQTVNLLTGAGAKGTPKQFKAYTPKAKGAKVVARKTSKVVARKSNSRDAEFQAIYDRAEEAGRVAAEACTPTPMVVSQHANPLDDNSEVTQSWYVSGGVCGFARVEMPATSAFAKWLVAKGLFRRQEKGIGSSIWDYGQSYERKSAHAGAMARSLSDSGISKVRIWTYVD